MTRKNFLKRQKMLANNKATFQVVKPPVKKFTKYQLLALTDGRVSSGMDDICDMLNHIFQESFFTHSLGEAYKMLKRVDPDWFHEQRKQVNAVKTAVGAKNFKQLCVWAKRDKKKYPIPVINETARAYTIANQDKVLEGKQVITVIV